MVAGVAWRGGGESVLQVREFAGALAVPNLHFYQMQHISNWKYLPVPCDIFLRCPRLEIYPTEGEMHCDIFLAELRNISHRRPSP